MNTLNQINEKARSVLRTALGPVDYARYQQQFSSGHGDYTEERQEIPQRNLQELCQHVRDLKVQGQLTPPPEAKVLEPGDS